MVPEEVTSVREGVGHYHLGVEAECLAAGEIIPSADPWVHFGDGSDGMEMQLEGGEYRFTVQIGDDEHRTLEGAVRDHHRPHGRRHLVRLRDRTVALGVSPARNICRAGSCAT